MGYKMKGFTYPGTKQSPLTKKAKNDPKSPDYLKYWRDPANRGELETKSKPGMMNPDSQRYAGLLAQVKAEGEGGGSGGGVGGKHGDEMHTGAEKTDPTQEIKPETGPAPKPPIPGEAPENKKEE